MNIEKIDNYIQPVEILSDEISPQLEENLELNIFLIPWRHNKLIIGIIIWS